MIWLFFKIIIGIILFIFGCIFIDGFIKGFKKATCLFHNYSLNHLIFKKNNDGLLYELEKESKTFPSINPPAKQVDFLAGDT